MLTKRLTMKGIWATRRPKADIDMTKQVIRALDSVDITVHDHVIVGRNDFLSFRAQRLI